MKGPISFLLNSDVSTQTDNGAVSAPAFSLTKVMAVVAPLLTALVSTVLSNIKGVNWSTTDYVWMIVSLVAFLTVTASADVLARAIATSAKRRADAAVRVAATRADARTRLMRFAVPVPGYLAPQGADGVRVHVLAASDAEPPEFLCIHDDTTMTWESAVTFDRPPFGNVRSAVA